MFLAFVRSLLDKPRACCEWLRPVTAVGVVCASLLGSSLSHATTASEVQQLIDSGQLSAASQRVQAQLKQDATDVQMRFFQAVIAAEQKKLDQAIRLFSALVKDHPELPEPYNNLAVLYAAKGQDRKAAEILEQAIRTSPSYATAHQNLGDVYAHIANEAYAKALQLDQSNKAARPQLALITHIFSSPASAVASAQAAVPRTAATMTPALVEPTAAAPAPAPEPAPAPATEPAKAAAPAEPAAPQTVAASSPPAPEAKVPPQPQAQEQQAKQAVERAVRAWAQAWEQQNMNGYYAAYSPRFKPQGMSLAEWKQERKSRIVGKPRISLSVQGLKITVNGDQAAASFRQHYASGGYKASTHKTLHMQNEGGKWRITREETGR